MTIFFAATGIKFFILNFLPHNVYLLLNRSNIFGCNNQFYFLVCLLFIGLNKIKFGACYLPVFWFVNFNKYFPFIYLININNQQYGNQQLERSNGGAGVASS